MLSLFAVALIMISAYTTDAATNTTPMDSSKKLDTTNVSASNSNVYNKTYSAWANNKSNDSTGKIRISGNDDSGIVDENNNSQVELDTGDGWQTWNFTGYIKNQEKYNGHVSLSVLRGTEPLVASKKVNVTAIVDAIGQQEAQFGDVQHVTLDDGSDNASVLETYGYGDCWADACWLYNKLSAAGIPVRIMGYEDGGIGDGWRHTWIEIDVGNGWQTWNYTYYNSQHAGDNGYGTPFVLIGPGNATADIMSTGY